MVLITGGLGYLGGRIANYLITQGHRVRIASSRDNVTIPQKLQLCEMVTIDLLNDDSLEQVCEGISCIIHLAALNAQSCGENPEEALSVNGLGTLKLLNSAKKMHVKQFLYFSTVHVYGAPLNGEFDELSLPFPKHHYSISHKIAEDYVRESSIENIFSTTIFRLSNAVGAPLHGDANCWMLVVNDLCRQVVMTQKMQVFSPPSTLRDYFPISSICSVLETSIKQNVFSNEIVNLSSGASISLQDLVQLIKTRSEYILGISPKIIFHKNTPKELDDSLLISNQKLVNTLPFIKSDLSDEIDNLLSKCQQWFKNED